MEYYDQQDLQKMGCLVRQHHQPHWLSSQHQRGRRFTERISFHLLPTNPRGPPGNSSLVERSEEIRGLQKLFSDFIIYDPDVQSFKPD